MIPGKTTKAALLLSSGSGGYDVAVAQHKALTGMFGTEDPGVCTATGEENKSEAKLAEICAVAEKLQNRPIKPPLHATCHTGTGIPGYSAGQEAVRRVREGKGITARIMKGDIL